MNELYYYATDAVLAALWDGELKLSAPCDFNDPFEFLPEIRPSSEEGQKFSIAFREASANNWYVLSLSKNNSNVRMWAQYGGNHSGLMIAFNINKGIFKTLKEKGYLREVDYSVQKRHPIDLENIKKREITVLDVENLCFRKGADWAHEQEWRALIPDNQLPEIRGSIKLFKNRLKAFIPLEHDCINYITLGHRSSRELYSSLFKLRDKKNAKWDIFMAKLSRDEFSFVQECHT